MRHSFPLIVYQYGATQIVVHPSSSHSLVQTHQTVNAIETLTAICHPLLSRKNYPVGAHHLPQLLRLYVYQLTLHASEWRHQWWLTLVFRARQHSPGH
jgi:hypothetical protein